LVHDFRSDIHLLGRTRREYQGSSAPQSFSVSLRLCFGRPDPGKLPEQGDFEIYVWETHHAGDLEGCRLLKRLNLFPWKTKSITLVMLKYPTAVFGILVEYSFFGESDPGCFHGLSLTDFSTVGPTTLISSSQPAALEARLGYPESAPRCEAIAGLPRSR
jgi:hypothetical protein